MNFINQSISMLAAAGGSEEGSGSILKTLGVDTPKLFAQIIIFLIVFLVLRKFAFGPVRQILDERKARIAEGEENLKKISKDLEDAEVKKGEVISEANSKAELLIGEARESAEVLAEKKREEATKEASAIVAKAHEAGALEQQQLRAELKRDVGRLIIDTTTKVTGKILNDDDQAKINEETSSQISL
jgi:F-type H+-transporting ATPase subunit b